MISSWLDLFFILFVYLPLSISNLILSISILKKLNRKDR